MTNANAANTTALDCKVLSYLSIDKKKSSAEIAERLGHEDDTEVHTAIQTLIEHGVLTTAHHMNEEVLRETDLPKKQHFITGSISTDVAPTEEWKSTFIQKMIGRIGSECQILLKKVNVLQGSGSDYKVQVELYAEDGKDVGSLVQSTVFTGARITNKEIYEVIETA